MTSFRKIIHIDMDAFFAAVEQRDNPALRGKPVAIGADEPRAVVSTASYEARHYGVHSAQSMVVAKRLCPSLVIVPPHFEKYKAVNRQIGEIFRDYTDLVEFVSIDEAFLDVTTNKAHLELAQDVALSIKNRIRSELNLTASAGVSYCKFLAKIASDYRKPDGLFTIHPDRAQAFIDRLPIEKFWGIGAKTAERMHYVGIFNGLQLREFSRRHLTELFGKTGALFHDFARGIDQRPVVTEHVSKSVGCERTFEKDLIAPMALIIETYHLTMELVRRLQRHADFEGHTLTLKVKYADFTQITRSVTASQAFLSKEQILPAAKRLLQKVELKKAVRLLGLSVSNPQGEDRPSPKDWIQLEFDF